MNPAFDTAKGANHMYPKLDMHTEKRLIALGNKKFIKTLLLTIGWTAAVLYLWYLYVISFERSFTHPTCFAFPLLLILPYFPFQAHKILFGKTFYGRVMSAKYRMRRKWITLTVAEMRNAEYQTADVRFVGRDGEIVQINYKQKSILAKNIYYKPDDYIFFVRGLRYPVRYPIPDDQEQICPSCGSFMKAGKRRCGWCKADFS